MLFNLTKSQLLDKTKHLTNVRKVTKLLETKFSIWKFKFGIDPVLGLLPGLGDIISAVISFYIVFVAVLHDILQKRMTYQRSIHPRALPVIFLNSVIKFHSLKLFV